jgi:hypothetical protein
MVLQEKAVQAVLLVQTAQAERLVHQELQALVEIMVLLVHQVQADSVLLVQMVALEQVE